MSTNPEALKPQPWNDHKVAFIGGTFDTRIETGEEYETRTLAELFAAGPACVDKLTGPAFIPSSYHEYDARSHDAQRSHGQYVALTADVDSGDHAPGAIQKAVAAFVADAAYLIYSSPHSRPGDRRWRVIVPLDQAVPFEQWFDAQTALFAFLGSRGIDTDKALSRAGQLVFLPNVPETHVKSGTALRGPDGEPLHFQRHATSLAKPGLKLTEGHVADGVAQIRRQRAEDEKKREAMRAEAAQRRANRPASDNASLIDDFNATNTVATMLELCGYEQSPRDARDWRSPYQTGETYATRVMDGGAWFSLSQSDTDAGVGQRSKEGCFGDAYDLYAHFKHGGDHKAAYRALGEERRGNVIRPERFNPPEWMNEAPLPDEMPDFPDYGPDDVDVPDIAEEEPAGLLPVFNPADWQGHRPPDRQWRWDNFVPNFQATLLTGAGAAGKSLATQQMSTCVAMGLPFLGVETKRCPTLYITCEDDLEELHRRQEAICASLGISLESTRGHLFLLSLQGQIGNELATFDHEGKMSVAPRYREIEATCLALGVRHVTIDNTAHTFAGNENDRHQVAAFVNLNNGLAQAIGGSVIMVGHPNKAGDSYSGSTAWENQVRSRLYLEIPKGDEGAPVDPDMRVLRNEKANYSQRGAEVTFYWLKGAFVTEQDMPQGTERDMRESAQAGYENKLFLDLLDTLTKQKRHVSHAANLPNYAPKLMASMPEAKGMSKANFARAMERLFALDLIAASVPLWKGRDRHPVLGLARKEGAK